MSRRLVVELHDVAPPFEAEIREQLRLLDAIGVQRCALLVVPNWHGQFPLAAYPSFLALLRSRAACGSELVLHGLTHQRQGPLRGTPLDRWRAQHFAGDAAEFLSLSRHEARDAVERGSRALREANLPVPATFCAPGWLLSSDAREGVRDGGLGRVTGLLTVLNMTAHRRDVWPSLGYMGAGRRQELGVQALNEIMFAASRSTGRARAFLHPQHIGCRSHARVVARIEGMIRDGWSVDTYENV